MDPTQQWNEGVQKRQAAEAQRRSEQSFNRGLAQGFDEASSAGTSAPVELTYTPFNWDGVFRGLRWVAIGIGFVLACVPALLGATFLSLATRVGSKFSHMRIPFGQAYRAMAVGALGYLAVWGAALIAVVSTRSTDRQLGRLIVGWDGPASLFDEPLLFLLLLVAHGLGTLVCALLLHFALRPVKDAAPRTPLSFALSLLTSVTALSLVLVAALTATAF